jgi:hypothetical protein
MMSVRWRSSWLESLPSPPASPSVACAAAATAPAGLAGLGAVAAPQPPAPARALLAQRPLRGRRLLRQRPGIAFRVVFAVAATCRGFQPLGRAGRCLRLGFGHRRLPAAVWVAEAFHPTFAPPSPHRRPGIPMFTIRCTLGLLLDYRPEGWPGRAHHSPSRPLSAVPQPPQQPL